MKSSGEAKRWIMTGVGLGMVLLASCSESQPEGLLGSAVIDDRTYQVASTVQGQLIAVEYEEGQQVSRGEQLAVVDTIPIVLRLQELEARRVQTERQIASKRADVTAAEAEVKGLNREVKRISLLASKGSVPVQEKDQLETRRDVAAARLDAAQLGLKSATSQLTVLEAQKAQLLEQLDRSIVRAPADGVILTRYRNRGEMAGPGMPLYELGKQDTMWADFYVPQPVLGALTLGQAVRIRVDKEGGDNKAEFLPATISWISDEAEFSPKNIQTRQSRRELVFRIRALAANPNGVLKRGLPVEVWK